MWSLNYLSFSIVLPFCGKIRNRPVGITGELSLGTWPMRARVISATVKLPAMQ